MLKQAHPIALIGHIDPEMDLKVFLVSALCLAVLPGGLTAMTVDELEDSTDEGWLSPSQLEMVRDVDSAIEKRSIERIVGGDAVERRTYPWHAVINYNDRYLCGGILVSDDAVLTSSVVARFYNRSQMEVVLGLSSFRKDGRAQAFNVSSIKLYDGVGANKFTVAIMYLDGAVSYNRFVQKVPALADNKFDKRHTFRSRKCYFPGFGTKREDVLKPSNKLRDINMKLSNTRQCKKYVEDRFQGNPVSATHLCSLETDDGAPCYGDQGGGIGCYVNKVFTLVGVFNVGVRGCEDPPVIFTKVSSLKTWIEDNI